MLTRILFHFICVCFGIQLCELASAPVRAVVTDEDHVPTKAGALSVLGECCGAGGQTFGALTQANAACIGEHLKVKALEKHAVHALALAYVFGG